MSKVVYISLEEFIARPNRAYDQCEELMEGEVIVSLGAKPSHASIVGRLRAQLAPLQQNGYELANDFSCILGGRSMPVPDLAVVEQDRWNKVVAADEWLVGSPELVIEAPSPSNRNLGQKADLYLEHGAEQVWLVYRKTRTVIVMTPEATTEARMGEVLELHGVQLRVDSIFVRL